MEIFQGKEKKQEIHINTENSFTRLLAQESKSNQVYSTQHDRRAVPLPFAVVVAAIVAVSLIFNIPK